MKYLNSFDSPLDNSSKKCVTTLTHFALQFLINDSDNFNLNIIGEKRISMLLGYFNAFIILNTHTHTIIMGITMVTYSKSLQFFYSRSPPDKTCARSCDLSRRFCSPLQT